MATADPDSSLAPPSERPADNPPSGHGWLLRWLLSLHALHGPPLGTPSPRHPALPTSWPTEPFVSARTAPFPVVLAPGQLSVLLAGFAPRHRHRGVATCPWQDVSGDTYADDDDDDAGWDDVPEHKWFVYATEEHGGRRARIHMHRSWTGVKLIELTVDTATSSSPRDEDDDDDGGEDGISTARGRRRRRPRITHLTFEMHEDYKLKCGDEGVYKCVAREVCWWVLGVCLGPEAGGLRGE